MRLKLNPLPESIRGKRLVVVDDSIVRGTTTRQVVAMLREAGAAEVHFRVSSPPYRWPCFYGMDTGQRSELLAADMSVGEIREYLGADSLAYLDLDRLVTATGPPPDSFCTACLSAATTRAGARFDTKHVLENGDDGPAQPERSEADAPTAAVVEVVTREPERRSGAPDLRRRRRRHRRRREGRRAHQVARPVDVPARGHRRRRRVRRALLARLNCATATRCSWRRPTASARSRSSPG